MLGTLNHLDKKVTIIGAGISGLISAYQLDLLGYEVTLIEKNNKVGGMLSSTHTPWGLVESAAHSLLVNEEIEKIFNDLKVPLLSVRKNSRARWIRRNAQFKRFPFDFFETLQILKRFFFQISFYSKKDYDHLTLEDWTKLHLGEVAVDALMGPMVNGIYAVHPKELLVQAIFPQLVVPKFHTLFSYLVFKKIKSIFNKKMSLQMKTPKEGMGSLIVALQDHLKKKLGSRFILNTEVYKLPSTGNVILCVPAQVASNLISAQDPILSQALNNIQYTPLITATVFLEKEKKLNLNGVGFLNALSECSPILGVLFNSSSFSERVTNEQIVSFTVMLGGSQNPQYVDESEEKLKVLIEDELTKVFHLQKKPLEIIIKKWKNAIPKYDEKITAMWKRANEGWCAKPGNLLFSNYSGDVSIRKMMEHFSSNINK